MNRAECVARDCQYGFERESATIATLEKYFNTPLKRRPRYDPFDFSNDEEKVLLEIKSRRFHKDKYDTTVVGFNKITHAHPKVKDGWTAYFVFEFTDGLFYWRMCPNDYQVKKFGNKYEKPQDYLFIPVGDLKKIVISKPQPSAEVDMLGELLEGLRLDFDCFKIDWNDSIASVRGDRIQSAPWRAEQKLNDIEHTVRTVREMLKQRVSKASDLVQVEPAEPVVPVETVEPSEVSEFEGYEAWGF